MFKPVSGVQLESFDPETRDMYRVRTHSDELTTTLMKLPRRTRNHLPSFISKENKTIAQWERDHSNVWWKLLGSFFLFCNITS